LKHAESILKGIKANPLIESLIELKGTPKMLLLTEPLWGIPFNLFMPFATVYMYALGVGDVQIGLLISASMFTQIFTSLFGGIITDKFGRRYTTFVFDSIAWVIPCLIWAFARNFWWFFAAAIINSVGQISGVSWSCLLVEEAPKNKLAHIFTWIYMSGRLAVFFAPISAVLMRRLTVIPTMRILYLFAFTMMSVKFVINVMRSKETPQGLARMRETKGKSVFTIFLGYKDVMRRIVQSRTMLRVMALTVLAFVMQLVLDSFFSLYVTQNLSIEESYLAYFPMLRAVIMLVFFFAVQKRLERLPYKVPMVFGMAMYVLSHAAILIAPINGIGWVVVYVICESIAFALFMPQRVALMTLAINPEERARIMSVFVMAVLTVSSPFGAAAGLLSDMNRRFPFVMNIIVFILMSVIILTGFHGIGGGGHEGETAEGGAA